MFGVRFFTKKCSEDGTAIDLHEKREIRSKGMAVKTKVWMVSI